jgi:hypothetical protein
MEGQGYGVVRRERGRVYVALDYGHTGGSHGHPDRLNLWLVNGDRRIFEDVGTGSYVERTLHWYRSTLAHNAPLVDGRSQDMVPGSLRAWDDHDGFSWIDAEAGIAGGVVVRRSVVIGPSYLIDRVEWNANRDVDFDLPLHMEAEVEGAVWQARDLVGGSGLEDGFDFVTAAETAMGRVTPVRITGAGVDGSVVVHAPHAWWRARAPGPPLSEQRSFLMVRARASHGVITSTWSWAGSVELKNPAADSLEIIVAGTSNLHRCIDGAWHVESYNGRKVVLAGGRDVERPGASPTEDHVGAVRFVPVVDGEVSIGDLLATGTGLRFDIRRSQYRRTEATWEEAGSPTATIMIAATATDLLMEVSVSGVEPNFAAAGSSNTLDNEHPDTNSAGVQLHLESTGQETRRLVASWLMVPVPGTSSVRVSARDDALHVPIQATWRPAEEGWQLLARIPRQAIGSPDAAIGLNVIVNEMPSWRERRRGQLVMGATTPGWAYLRGDRHEPEHLVLMTVRDV